ncbi:MAG TPA: hypothetical protein VFZ58_04690 [Candidatus Saccharimonadales bacterium]
MDIRTSHRPQPKTVSTPVSAANQVNMSAVKQPRRDMKWIIAGIAIVLSLIIATAFLWGNKFFGAEKYINRDGYQAVFLSNSQVYFGHLEQASPHHFVLKDVYYLQVQQPVQPQKDDAAGQTPQQASLSKLGGEVHGPEDVMFINDEHMLFWENLKADSKVVQAIKENQKK